MCLVCSCLPHHCGARGWLKQTIILCIKACAHVGYAMAHCRSGEDCPSRSTSPPCINVINECDSLHRGSMRWHCDFVCYRMQSGKSGNSKTPVQPICISFPVAGMTDRTADVSQVPHSKTSNHTAGTQVVHNSPGNYLHFTEPPQSTFLKIPANPGRPPPCVLPRSWMFCLWLRGWIKLPPSNLNKLEQPKAAPEMPERLWDVSAPFWLGTAGEQLCASTSSSSRATNILCIRVNIAIGGGKHATHASVLRSVV